MPSLAEQPVEQSSATAFVGNVRAWPLEDGPTYFIQRADNGEVYYQEGATFDEFGPRNVIKDYTVSEQDIAWLDDKSLGEQDMPQAFKNAFFNILSPRLVPNPAGASSEPPRPPQAEKKPAYDPNMIAAIEDIMRVLERLEKHDAGFGVIRTQLKAAVRQENMPITESVERHAASTPTQSAPTKPRPAPASEKPVTPQEHLVLLKELQTKLNHLKTTHQHAIPPSVHDVLNQLTGQVEASIRIVERDIANKKAVQKQLKQNVTSEREKATPKPTTAKPGLFEKRESDQEEKELSSKLARERSQSL